MLRPYQLEAVAQIYKQFKNGRNKVLLQMPTGSGKTTVFAAILKDLLQRSKRGLLVVHGKKLVDQASARLAMDHVAHGVTMSGRGGFNPSLHIQVASIDTLYSRRSNLKFEHLDLIVIDEAHLATSQSFRWLLDTYPTAKVLAVTATPHTRSGLKSLAECIVKPVTLGELMEGGYLVPPIYYAPSKPNLRGIPIDKKTGDYEVGRLHIAMDRANIYGDILETYQEITPNKRALVFCCNVEHALSVSKMFNQAGISAATLTSLVKDQQRQELFRQFENGEIHILTNCTLLSTGVDLPCVEVVILARPTKSYNLYIQTIGRAARPYRGKDAFYVLDHARCIEEHGFIEHERETRLDTRTQGSGSSCVVVTCAECFYCFDPNVQKSMLCPECGKDNKRPNKKRVAVREDGSYEMVRVAPKPETKLNTHAMSATQLVVFNYCRQAIAMNYKRGWVYHKVEQRFNPLIAQRMAGFIGKTFNKLKGENDD